MEDGNSTSSPKLHAQGSGNSAASFVACCPLGKHDPMGLPPVRKVRAATHVHLPSTAPQ
jgi:hypothetical protein